MPISEIQFTGYSGGEFADGEQLGAAEDELLEIAFPFLGDSYWNLSVEELRSAVESHPWVRQATVSKRWPEKVWVGVDEYVPVARWNQGYLLSMNGDLIGAEVGNAYDHLPLFSLPWVLTPKADQVRALVRQYNDLQSVLNTLAMQIQELTMLTTNNLSLRLVGGLEIHLGTAGHRERLQRFVRFSESLGLEELAKLETVDLRYPNGVAIRQRSSVKDVSQQDFSLSGGQQIVETKRRGEVLNG